MDMLSPIMPTNSNDIMARLKLPPLNGASTLPQKRFSLPYSPVNGNDNHNDQPFLPAKRPRLESDDAEHVSEEGRVVPIGTTASEEPVNQQPMLEQPLPRLAPATVTSSSQSERLPATQFPQPRSIWDIEEDPVSDSNVATSHYNTQPSFQPITTQQHDSAAEDDKSTSTSSVNDPDISASRTQDPAKETPADDSTAYVVANDETAANETVLNDDPVDDEEVDYILEFEIPETKARNRAVYTVKHADETTRNAGTRWRAAHSLTSFTGSNGITSTINDIVSVSFDSDAEPEGHGKIVEIRQSAADTRFVVVQWLYTRGDAKYRATSLKQREAWPLDVRVLSNHFQVLTEENLEGTSADVAVHESVYWDTVGKELRPMEEITEKLASQLE